jgi:glycerol-3-phosphate dehydrogenase
MFQALQIAEIVRPGTAVFDKTFLSSTGDVRRISSKYPYIEAEVKFAVEQEYAVTAVDVLARRTRLAYIDSEAARSACKRVVHIMGNLLKWSHAKRVEEEKATLRWLDTMNMEEKVHFKSEHTE